MIKKPLISVIIPVYNVEKYLRETIENIANQDIGFTKNVELIIVNDGSTDGSEKISKEFVDRYPNNIIYIKQKNSGVSAARNRGLSEARGEYIHFMDSDDLVSNNFYSESARFLNDNDTDLVASKMLLIGGKSGGHYLNYKFKTTRLVDLNVDTKFYQYSIVSCVIKKDALKAKSFSGEISIAEDARLIAEILLERKSYGVLSNTYYKYRGRDAGGSLMDGRRYRKDFYFGTPIHFWQQSLKLWEDRKGHTHTFMQNMVLNDIQWRINEEKTQPILDNKEEAKYKNIVYETVAMLDDSVIMSADRLSLSKKIFLLKKKYGSRFEKVLSRKEDNYYIEDTKILSTADEYFGVTLDFIRPTGENKFLIEGTPNNDSLLSDDKLKIRTSVGLYDVRYVERHKRKQEGFLGDSFHEQSAFEATIEVSDQDKIEFITNSIAAPVLVRTNRYTGLGDIKGSYKIFSKLILKPTGRSIKIHKNSFIRHLYYEIILQLMILANVRLGDTIELAKEAVRTAINMGSRPSGDEIKNLVISVIKPPAFLVRNILLNFQNNSLRTFYHITPKISPLWIVSDRGLAAGDNGEAFFKYLISIGAPYRYYFAINIKSPHYKRVKKIGPVISTGSYRYKYLFLKSDKIISSHADIYVVNPFGYRESQMVDLYNFDFIFLQHGITKNDISGWLNRFDKNIQTFITSSKLEYESVLQYPFYYTEENVLLSGLPRYDLLTSKPKNRVILAPTWRKYLTGGKLGKNGDWGYIDNFKESEYFKFYNRLINDDRIKDSLKKAKAVGELYIHPAHSAQAKDFSGNKYFRVSNPPHDYNTMFKEGSLLITDYSSVYFDFAYLDKPVIYCQFDKEYFFKNHEVYEEGYFNEAEDGFGPVVYDYESLVYEIQKSIERKFKLEEKYKKRIDNFFAYRDNNNSKRVYDRIIETYNN